MTEKKREKPRIVLIPTLSFPVSKASIYIPLGILAIKSFIKEEAEVIIADMTVQIKRNIIKADEHFYTAAKKYLCNLDADLYAFSTKTGSLIQTLTMAEAVKRDMPRALVVLGGPQATACDIEILKSSSIDFVIRGEGEVPFLMLAKALKDRRDISDIPSLTFKGKRTPDAERIQELDTLPIPYYEEYKEYYRNYTTDKPEYDIQSYVPIDSGRGCPSHCKFCYSPTMWKGQCRIKSAERLFTEVKYLYEEFGVNSVFFTEDNFTLSKKRIQNFCHLIKTSALPVSWSCYSRIDTLDPDTVLIMKEAGCRQIYYGVESGSSKILNELGKLYSQENAHELIASTVRLGIDVTASYIVGFAEETDEDISATLNAYADSIIAGAISKLHVLGIEYGTKLYSEVMDRLKFCPSLTPEVLKKEYLINADMYKRISTNQGLFSYFYICERNFFSTNWIKKFRIEYCFSVFKGTLKKIREEHRDNDFLLFFLKEMIDWNKFVNEGETLVEKVDFFRDVLLSCLKKRNMGEIVKFAIFDYEDWKSGKHRVKSISKTL